jgi:anti-anti-sigma regulatory factor
MVLGKCGSCGSQVDITSDICDFCGQPPVEPTAKKTLKAAFFSIKKPIIAKKSKAGRKPSQNGNVSIGHLELKVRSLGSAIVIDIIGSLTEKNITSLMSEVGEIFIIHDQKSFILNLSGLTELSQHALAALIHLRQFLKNEGGQLSLLVGAKPVVSALNSISSLSGVQIFTDENAARRHFYSS